jgi:thymidylate kinase
MNMHEFKATFFSFEGMPGCGKERLFSEIQLFLEQNNISGILKSEPTKYLPTSSTVKFQNIQKILAENRLSHMEKFIIPHLTLNEIVGVNSYFPNSAVFGSKLDSVDEAYGIIIKNNRKLIIPDVIFFVNSCLLKCLQKTKQELTAENFKLWQFRFSLYKKIIHLLQSCGTKVIYVNPEISKERFLKIFQKHCC